MRLAILLILLSSCAGTTYEGFVEREEVCFNNIETKREICKKRRSVDSDILHYIDGADFLNMPEPRRGSN